MSEQNELEAHNAALAERDAHEEQREERDAMTDPKQSPPEGARDLSKFPPEWLTAREKLEAEVASLRAENEGLRVDVDALNRGCVEAQARERMAEADRDTLRAELEKARAQNTEVTITLGKQVQLRARQHARADAAEAQVATLTAELEKANHLLRVTCAKDYEALEAELGEVRARRHEAERVSVGYADELDVAEERIAVLTRERDDYKRQWKNAASANIEFAKRGKAAERERDEARAALEQREGALRVYAEELNWDGDVWTGPYSGNGREVARRALASDSSTPRADPEERIAVLTRAVSAARQEFARGGKPVQIIAALDAALASDSSTPKEPDPRAFLGEPVCGKPGCPCSSTPKGVGR